MKKSFCVSYWKEFPSSYSNREYLSTMAVAIKRAEELSGEGYGVYPP